MNSQHNNIYSELGIRPIINCQGQRTMLGGSRLNNDVFQSMQASNMNWALMREVMEKASQYVARHMGVEAAYITSGCAAAMALSAAACISRKNPTHRGFLPNPKGMQDEILLQKKQRYSYERAFTSTGGKLIYVGSENSCSKKELENSIGPNTAAIAYLVQTPSDPNILSLEDTVEIGRKNNLPVIADAAAQIYPIEYFLKVAQAADLVCFAGKFFGAPNSTGFVCGKKPLVDAVTDQGFIAFQTQPDGQRAIGRPMKMDRQSIIALVTALKSWLTMNHEDRLLRVDRMLDTINKEINSIPHIKTRFVTTEHFYGSTTLLVEMDTVALGKTPEDIAIELDQGDPRIWIVLPEGKFYGAEYLHFGGMETNNFAINAHALEDGEEKIVAERIKTVLSS
ncbi:MAG: hypothetical protein FI718_09540 [SAR202 cluster bacterium]|nr:hypothetical protein [SAR202 cluster bacterium]|tara:strand:- start:29605 stop:30792 length:1188 start_codon:yes stop_codon:yes gene_type:complete